MRILLREIVLLTGLFLFLALGMHMDRWLSSPIEHIHALSSHIMPLHPLIYTAVTYAAVMVLRGVFALLGRLLFQRKD